MVFLLIGGGVLADDFGAVFGVEAFGEGVGDQGHLAVAHLGRAP